MISLGLPDDGYDYLRHLRNVGPGPSDQESSGVHACMQFCTCCCYPPADGSVAVQTPQCSGCTFLQRGRRCPTRTCRSSTHATWPAQLARWTRQAPMGAELAAGHQCSAKPNRLVQEETAASRGAVTAFSKPVERLWGNSASLCLPAAAVPASSCSLKKRLVQTRWTSGISSRQRTWLRRETTSRQMMAAGTSSWQKQRRWRTSPALI